MTTLELRHLGKIYPNGDEAVHDLNVTLASGEFFVLVGPSGCGKTTALRMVAGLEKPTSGDVLIGGEIVTGMSPQERDVAMAFQHGALYPHLTVGENIGFSLRLAGVPAATRNDRVRAVAEMLDLVDVLDRNPGKISGGQAQRVAMGRALIRQPRLFLMDEPMSNLDAKMRIEARAEILAIQRRLGVTTLYVTHDQIEAMALGDRVGVMRDGRLVQCDTPTAVYQAPIDLFVAQFMGSPPMNVLLATVTGRPGALALRIGSHLVGVEAGRPQAYPALTDRIGGEIAVGIRPEAFRHDETNVDLELSLEFSQTLGSAQHVHAYVDAPSVSQPRDAPEVSHARSSTIVAQLDADDSVDLFRPVRLAIDTEQLYCFDLGSGAPLTT
jgi:multiple sugar transport system ATP-binding protein